MNVDNKTNCGFFCCFVLWSCRFGSVMSCRTITTHHGVCTGLGFVMYISNESVDRAIKGLKELGYHAEVAIQSATNKLRCKVKSDTLFLQNIPNHIKETKVHSGDTLLFFQQALPLRLCSV